MFLSVPYSTGWKAFINGEETELEKADYMYQAIRLREGLNKIELKYKTPGLLEGIIAAAGAGGIVLIWSIGQIRKKRKSEANT